MTAIVQTPVDIGTLIERRPEIRGGRPCVAGTGVSVKRLAGWHHLGYIPEQIALNYGYISLAQVHAALAYYYANKAEIDADIADEIAEGDKIEHQFSHTSLVKA